MLNHTDHAIKPSDITPEAVFLGRRTLLQAAVGALASSAFPSAQAQATPTRSRLCPVVPASCR